MIFPKKVQSGTRTSLQVTKTEAVEIFEVLTMAMSQTVEIDVTTCIHDNLDQTDQMNQVTDPNLNLKSATKASFATQINLLDGTVNHEIDLKLIDNNAYGELQRWHIEQVKQKQDSLITSLQRLEEMRHLVLKLQQKAH